MASVLLQVFDRYRHSQVCRILLLCCLAALNGCSGCRPEAQEKLTREEFEKRAREQREALELSELLAIPSNGDTKTLSLKPGHWIETQQQFKSNREDLQVVVVGNVARGAELAKIPGTDVVNAYTRRTSFPKGQKKNVELQYFIPYSGKQEDPFDFAKVSNQLQLRTELLSWPLMTPILQAPNTKPANELKEHEFLLTVLSPQPLGYEFLNFSDAVQWRGDALLLDDQIRSYYVSLVKPIDNLYPFPHSMLTMTSLAAIVWDDVSVDSLSTDQQNAILDWIHWGGQLIINGPNSWTRLQNSFLTPYLPADAAESIELDTASFAELSQTWVTYDRFAPNDRPLLEITGAKMGGLKLTLNERGSWLPGCGELVAESVVGRGRVVVTAFPMREPRINRWKYFSSFFSTGLLRRPPRTIVFDPKTRSFRQSWAAALQGRERDAALHTNLRILSRDLPLTDHRAFNVNQQPNAGKPTELSQPQAEIANDIELANNSPVAATSRGGNNQSASSPPQLEPRPSSLLMEQTQWNTGAAWNDSSGFSVEALSALKAAAGIELPNRGTILYLLAGYLICLVPLNWLVFRLLGRLEYAWLAAPVLALLGVAVVTKVARLDIGFARRTTEISLLEMYGDYPRGHLTQYIALYTSLSTNYAIDFPENGSVALPMGDVSRTRRRAAAEVRNLRTNYGRTEGVTLEPLTVYSNSTEMIHAEQVVEVNGGLLNGSTSSGQPAVKNTTRLNLQGALVLRCPKQGVVETSWIGELKSNTSAALDFKPATDSAIWEYWNANSITQRDMPTAKTNEDEVLWIGKLLAVLVEKTPLAVGQMRLIAYTDQRPGDLTVSPAEDQFDGRCIVIAHLQPAELPKVSPDVVILSRPISGELQPVVAPAEDGGSSLP